MTYPSIPIGTAAATYPGIVDGYFSDIDARLTSVEGSAGLGTEAIFGIAPLDSFAGASDDAKLTAALTYAAAQTYPPTIQLGNRAHSFATMDRAPFEGMRIAGPEGYSAPERNSQTKMACRVNLTGTPATNGGWFTMPSSTNIFQVSLMRLAFVGGANARVLGQGTGTGVWYFMQLRDIYSNGLRNVLGSFAAKLVVTAVQFDGSWEINNCLDTAFHLGGSDSVALWPDGMLLDSAASLSSAGNGSVGHPHIWFDFMEKSTVGPIYMTTEGTWAGIKVDGDDANTTGSNMGGRLTFNGGIWEGRNAGAPCDGAVYRQDGGLVTLRDVTMNYGMETPSNMGHTPTDAGMAHIVNNARCYADGTTYDRATGVAETVPLFYCDSTSKLRVFNTDTLSKVNTWTGLPRVDDGGGSGIVNDATTTLI